MKKKLLIPVIVSVLLIGCGISKKTNAPIVGKYYVITCSLDTINLK